MEAYESYARFYDASQGPRRDVAGYLRLIQRHHPAAKSLLEIACGTGELLVQFARHYDVTGLDVSGAMLHRARSKLPGVEFHQRSMVGFNLGRRFDVIVCAYDSINHLLTYQDWERTFRAARRHLCERGVFIFDAHTEANLERLANAPAHVLRFDEHYMIMDVAKGRADVHDWDIKVFEPLRNGRYRLHHDRIRERAFPKERVLKSLRALFPTVRVWDAASMSRPDRSSKRLFYLCRA